MANKILLSEMDDTPPQIVFRDVTDFSPTAANDLRKGTPTLVQLNLEGLADDAYRQSTKFDFGANWASAYAVRAAIEHAATPVAGEIWTFYLVPSQSATAGTGNAAGASGADSAYTGYSSNANASIKQAVQIGIFVCTAQATPTIQVAECGTFVPTERYGSLIVFNTSGAAYFATDAAEAHIVFDPIIMEVQ